MINSYVDNQNPIIGARNGSKQEISLFDKELGNRRIISTTPEKIDEYVQNRKKVSDEAKKKYFNIQAIATFLSLIPGAIMLLVNKAKNSGLKAKGPELIFATACLAIGTIGSSIFAKNKIEKAKEKLNQEFINNNK